VTGAGAVKEFWKRFSRNRSAVGGLLILMAVILLAILAPILYPDDPFSLAGRPMVEPFEGFLLGTDILGRNVAAGIAILLTVLAINLVGEGLNDAFNPRLRNR
jgi:ABC-type dipeptide/oligopeptide/nickel transport system permease subunit